MTSYRQCEPAPLTSGTKHLRVSKRAVGFVAFVAVYIGLDWVSYIHGLAGVAITPWNPSPGLSLAVLLVAGLEYGAAIALGGLLSTLILPATEVGVVPALISSLVVAGGYTGCAAVLKYGLRIDIGLSRSLDLIWLFLISLVASAIIAVGFVVTYAAAGILPWGQFGLATFQYWIGDAIGIAIITPLILVSARHLKRQHALRALQEKLLEWRAQEIAELALQVLAVIAVTVLIPLPASGKAGFKFFYLFFLPLIWIAARRGLVGAIWAVVGIEACLLAALQFEDQSTETVRSFQLLMFTLTFTGLLLGSVVSEHRRAERALSASKRHMQAILSTAPDAVITVDANGNIESFNGGAERLFGIPALQAIGANLGSFLPAQDLMIRVAHLAARGGQRVSQAIDGIEVIAKCHDGLERPVELTAGWLEAEPRPRYTLVVRDITIRKENAARIREHESALFHVSRISVAGEMASGIAHELNQPLTAILAFAQGCRRLVGELAAPPGAVLHGIDQIISHADRAGLIINRLREFLRDGTTHRSAIGVGQLVEESIGLVQAEALQKGVEIRQEISLDLPRVVVDRIQIEQVLINLLRNAIEAINTAARPVRKVTVDGFVNADRLAEITVTDSGPGVAEELGARLFHPFISSKPRGMGLGLSISRTIVEAHGGKLWLAENSAAGAAFHLTLPLEEHVEDDGR